MAAPRRAVWLNPLNPLRILSALRFGQRCLHQGVRVEDLATFHDVTHGAGVTDVVERVAFDDDEIGPFSDLDGTEVIEGRWYPPKIACGSAILERNALWLAAAMARCC